jgi:hypothetical protein
LQVKKETAKKPITKEGKGLLRIFPAYSRSLFLSIQSLLLVSFVWDKQAG